MATYLCFPILRFSSAHGTNSDNSIPWHHIAASDLFALLDGGRTRGNDHVLEMRIVQGNRVLESIDIGAYADQAVAMQYEAEQAGRIHAIGSLPIFALMKGRLLSIRYHLDGKPKRVQLALRNETECQRILSIIQQRGVSLQELPQGNTRPPTSMSVLSATDGRPLSRDTKRQEGVNSHLLSRNEAVAPTQAVPNRPTTSHMYRSHTAKGQPPQFSTFSHASNAIASKAGDTPQQGQMMATNGLDWNARGYESSNWWSSNALKDQFKDANLDTGGEPHARDARSGSRPGSSALDLPPLPRPNPVNAVRSSSTLRGGSTPKASSMIALAPTSPLKRSSDAGHHTSVDKGFQTPMRDGLFPDTSISDATGPFTNNPATSTQKPSLMDELLRRREPLDETTCNRRVQRANSLADAPYEIVSPPGSSACQPAPKSRVAAEISMRDLAPSKEQKQLEKYSSQTVDDRQAALEEFMVASMENPAFTTLCEDVENSWRRIALQL